VTTQRDGSHLPRLAALRQLRDPALRPVFYQLAGHEDWQVQVHATLGLAEIDESRRIDPWLVTRIDERAQQALVANAIDMELIGPEQISELLDWEDLEPMPRVLLIAEQFAAGAEPDRATLERLAARQNLGVSGLSSLLVAELGDAGPFSAHRERLRDLSRRERERHTLWLLEGIRQYELQSGLAWVNELLADPDLDDDIAYWAVFTALVLDPSGGMRHWEVAIGDEPGYRNQVRYGMLLLAAGEEIPSTAYDRLTDERPLLRAMVRAGKCFSEGRDPTDALIELIDIGHMKSANWAMDRAESLPNDQAAQIYRHLIDTVEREGPGQGERVARAVSAVTGLFELDPDGVLRRLVAAEDDSLSQEVLLLGLIDCAAPTAGEAAGQVRRIGAGRADSLALLLAARHVETLPRDDLNQLGRIAAGGGLVSAGLQVQASWLYLKHAGTLEPALGSIFED
jgi:hypothetical protein